LIDSNRLLLRPGESLGRELPPGWIFWVAREDQQLPVSSGRLGGDEVATAVERLRRIIVAANAAGVALDLSAPNLVVMPGGDIHVRRPGLIGDSPPNEAAALATLRGAAVPGLIPIVARATSLAALSEELARIPADAQAWGTPQTRPAATVAGAEALTMPIQATRLAPASAAAMAQPSDSMARAAPYMPAAVSYAPPPVRPGVQRGRIADGDGGSRRGAAIAAALLLALGAIVLFAIVYVLAGGLGRGGAPLSSLLAGLPAQATATPVSVTTSSPAAPSATPMSVTPAPSAALVPTPLATASPAPIVVVVTPTPVPAVTPLPQPSATPTPAVATPTPNPPTVAPTQPPPPAAAWHVPLDASDTNVNNGDLVTFTATASESVAGTPYVIQIFNPDTAFIHKSCGSGATCSIGGRRENSSDTYQARVSRSDGSDVQAQSQRVTVTWSGPPANPGWSVSIAASQYTAANGDVVYITATTNRDVTGSGFVIQIYNPDTGFIHKQCSSGTSCTVGGARQNVTAAYQARISATDGSNVQARSDRIEVTWR
jgi:hypothetical protein